MAKLRPMPAHSGALFLSSTMEAQFQTDPVFYLRFPRQDADALLAVGVDQCLVLDAEEIIDWIALRRWIESKPDWVFGWMGYDARRAIEHFDERVFKRGLMPVLCLVKPKHVARIKDGKYDML
jgi:hypothetical protein